MCQLGVLPLPRSTYYNFCSPEQALCEMDSALTWSPPGSCYLLQQTVAHPSSLMLLLANGSDVTTTAGAPLGADLETIPLQLPGYSGLLGCGVFGSGNVSWAACCAHVGLPACMHPRSSPLAVHRHAHRPCSLPPSPLWQFACPQSFQDFMCAIKGGPAEAAAACNAAQPQCTGFAATSSALITSSAPGGSGTAEAGSGPGAAANQIGILKNESVLYPHQLSWSPFQIAFYQTGRVQLVPLNASDYPAVRSPGLNCSATLNVLMRPQAELRSMPSGGWDAAQ